jgi:hypothetical protein
MERIHYAGDVVFTGTDISRALLSYARALAQDGSSATVEIPIYHEDGSHGTAEFLIGPASQVIADSIDSEWEELVDTKLVEELRAAARVRIPFLMPRKPPKISNSPISGRCSRCPISTTQGSSILIRTTGTAGGGRRCLPGWACGFSPFSSLP